MSEPAVQLTFEPEGAHQESAIEWWFVQGYYEGGGRRRHFMTTLFRSSLDQDAGAPRNGFQLLLTVLDEDGAGPAHAATWVDPDSIGAAARKLEELGSSHLDPAVRRAMISELDRHGPPHPIRVQESPMRFVAEPLAAAWDHFALSQDEEGFDLRFREPDTDIGLSLRLEPDVLLLQVALGSVVEMGMSYRCYPRARLHGIRGDDAVTGEVWIDHQWGESGWFLDPNEKLLLGWDWFGINLEDGSDWLVMRHWDARSRELLATHATARVGNETERSSAVLEATPTRYWESPTTRIRYPVEWRLELPELDASFTFVPRADDQEVATFGAARTVWEGAGEVTGTVGGRPVAGRARGEFHGYGYVFDYRDYLSTMARRVDEYVEELLPRRFELSDVERLVGPARWQHEPQAYTDMIARPVWDMFDRSGKHWRPIFGMLMSEALGGDMRPYEGLLSVTTELMHSGALVVDDIEDDSRLRRGQEALHLRYGRDVALNAANALYFLPSSALMQHPKLTPEQQLRLLQIKERVCIEAHCGQATDIYWSRSMTPERIEAWLADDLEAKILQMYDMKTGAGARGLVDSLTMLLAIDPATTSACTEFARAFAVSFQIADDVLNFSGSDRWTKVPGEDLASGKLTYVIATALRRLDPASAARLRQILCTPELRCGPPGLDEGIALVRDSGALQVCQEAARKMTEQAWDDFTIHLRPSEPKIMLHAMCLRLIDMAGDA